MVGDNEFINADSVRIGWDHDCNSTLLEDSVYKLFSKALKIDELGEAFGEYCELARGNHIPNGYLIRVEALRKVLPFIDEAPLEDLYMHLQLAKMGKMYFIDQILFSYRWHSSNTIKQKKKMLLYSRKTYCYEELLLERLGERKWIECFYNYNKREKTKVNLRFIKLGVLSTYAYRSIIIEIFGYKFSCFKRRIKW